MTSIQAQIQLQERRQAQLLKRNIKRLIHDQLNDINAWWLISFHYRDHHSKEDELLQDVADLKRKLHRIIFQSRDKTIKGAGKYPYPKMLFFHETSHQGTGQFHSHLITEKLPQSLNTQYGMERRQLSWQRGRTNVVPLYFVIIFGFALICQAKARTLLLMSIVVPMAFTCVFLLLFIAFHIAHSTRQ